MNNQNLACRIFKEQLELIQQLPESERAIVLYEAIMASYNQNEIQNEIQNENAYVSVSVSVLGNCIYNLLSRNIVWKSFSNNYGGARVGAGRPKNNQNDNQDDNQVRNQDTEHSGVLGGKEKKWRFIPPKDANQVYEYGAANGMVCTMKDAEDFFDYYSGIGWCIGNEHRTPMVAWEPFWKKWLRNPVVRQKPSVKMSVKEMKELANQQELEKIRRGER